jgi:hypothetical protein
MSGQERAVCGAKTRGGGVCQHPAGWGTPYRVGRCKAHGGRTRAHLKRGAMLTAQAEAAALGAVSLDPHEALQFCVDHALREVLLADGKVKALAAEQLAAPIVTTTRRRVEVGEDGAGTPAVEVEQRIGAATMNVWVAYRAQALERLARFAKMAADAGVDERRVRVQERQLDALAAVVNAVLADLRAAGLSPELEAAAAESFRAHAAQLDVIAGSAVEVAA